MCDRSSDWQWKTERTATFRAYYNHIRRHLEIINFFLQGCPQIELRNCYRNDYVLTKAGSCQEVTLLSNWFPQDHTWVDYRGFPIGLAECGIWLFFVVIFGI